MVLCEKRCGILSSKIVGNEHFKQSPLEYNKKNVATVGGRRCCQWGWLFFESYNKAALTNAHCLYMLYRLNVYCYIGMGQDTMNHISGLIVC